MPQAVPLMTLEAREAPERVGEMIAAEGARIEALAERLRALDPPFVLTVGRGSSDHASLYARYLFETVLGLVTASAAPSVVTAYGAPLKVAGAFVLALSQSGASPDIVRVVEDETLPSVLSIMERLKAAGAPLVVMSSSAAALGLASVALPYAGDAHPALDPLVAVQAFYGFVAPLAAARGLDPDRPRNLAKVTRTL